MPDWTYRLTDEDRELMRRLARRRDRGKPDTCHNGSVCARESVARHARGLRGEIAFARLFGLDVDQSRRGSGDDGYDFECGGGLTVDVKYRTKPGSDLALSGPTLHGCTADTLALAWGSGPVRLVGWTTPVRLAVAGERQKWPGVGEKLVMRPENLFEMDGLQRIVAVS